MRCAGSRPPATFKASAVASSPVTRTQPLVVKGRYVNPGLLGRPPAEGGENGFRQFLKWRRERRNRPPRGPEHVPRAERVGPVPAPPRAGLAATWVGHSTLVLQLDGKTLLLDPVWSDRIGTVVKRRTPPGVAWEDLPPIDAVLLSHDHYDHLDAGTLRRLPRDTPVYCPTGVGRWLRKRGFTRVQERGWWEEATLEDHRLTCVPAQHFSGRTPWDRDRTLWGGWVVEGPRGSKAYFAGDSGYFPGFREIGAAFPGLDLALIPIGAYEPRWFMSPVHVDPAQAGEAFLDVGAARMLPIHWGTFRLADEGIDEPPRVLEAWWREKGLDPARLRVPALGERVEVPRSPGPADAMRPGETVPPV